MIQVDLIMILSHYLMMQLKNYEVEWMKVLVEDAMMEAKLKRNADYPQWYRSYRYKEQRLFTA